MTNITLAEKIAAVERAISDWDGYSIDTQSWDRSVLQAVLADLRERPNLRCEGCHNGIQTKWWFCPWCGRPLSSEGADFDTAHSIEIERKARRAGAEEMRGNAIDAIREVKRTIGAHDGSSIANALEHAATKILAISVGENG